MFLKTSFLLTFKFSALKKLIGFEKKLPPGALQKKIAEQGLGKAIGKDAVSIVGQEIPAEIGQEILTKIQAGKDAFSEEAIQENKEVEAIVFFSGGLGAYNGPKYRSKARKQIKIAEKKYKKAVKVGMAKGVTRKIVPEGLTKTRLYMNVTLRSWVHYIDLRSANGTQKEHMEIAKACAEVISKIFPRIDSQ